MPLFFVPRNVMEYTAHVSWYFDDIYLSIICIPVSQSSPSNPATQVQLYPPCASSHVASFWHGVLSHALTATTYTLNLSHRTVRYDSSIFGITETVCGELCKAVNTFKFNFHRRFLCCFVYVRVQVPRVLCNTVHELSN